ncbi:MAG TPA: hypothetical protein VGT61_08970 [Thermomicrobiales bacterium]|jgi:hypothetical protein|nr:hypothetical protein [Thermomicrobiales bacterium]
MNRHSPTDARLEDARTAFEREEVDLALEVLRPLAMAGPLPHDVRDILDLVLPSATDSALTAAVLAHNGESMTPLERARWQARRFDALAEAGDGQARDAALDLLAAATMAGADGWLLVQSPSRQAAIAVALSDPDDQIDALEQETLAPAETGLPERAVGRALILGREMIRARRPDAAREVERILHGIGEPALAYVLEDERKRLGPVRLLRRARDPEISYVGPRLSVVIAGGHPTLRARIRQDLERLDLADTRDFPSAWEGSRVGRHARDTLVGADLAVIIRRQIAHSTSDQVASAARALAVPVIRADTPTISAVRRAVGTFAESLTSLTDRLDQAPSGDGSGA